jgi:hypothetical protein
MANGKTNGKPNGKKQRAPKRSPRPVDPVNNYEDHICLLLAIRGRSNRAIMKATNLSPAQIGYRMKKFGISRMDYRNGEGAFVRSIDKVTAVYAEKELLRYLRIHVGN